MGCPASECIVVSYRVGKGLVKMIDQPEFVEGQIAFLSDDWRDRDEIPRIYSRETRHANTTKRDILIHNARLRHQTGDLDLDGSGFVLVEHETTVTDFRDKDAITDVYFPEMKQLILAETGALDAFAVQFYQVRTREPEHFFDAYSLYLHCDFSPKGWMKLAQHWINEGGSDRKFAESEYDFALYNLWRPVAGEVQQDPLVIMDASTLNKADIVDYSTVEEAEKATAALPLYAPDQKFYYVPRMQENEVLILKQLDSRPDRALVCPHTSFHDPTAPANANHRESIDVRFVCVFRKGD